MEAIWYWGKVRRVIPVSLYECINLSWLLLCCPSMVWLNAYCHDIPVYIRCWTWIICVFISKYCVCHSCDLPMRIYYIYPCTNFILQGVVDINIWQYIYVTICFLSVFFHLFPVILHAAFWGGITVSSCYVCLSVLSSCIRGNTSSHDPGSHVIQEWSRLSRAKHGGMFRDLALPDFGVYIPNYD